MVQFALSALRAPLPKGEARARWIIGNRPINRNLTLWGSLVWGGWRTYVAEELDGVGGGRAVNVQIVRDAVFGLNDYLIGVIVTVDMQ